MAITAGAQSETNVKWPAREVFRSLDTTPFPFSGLDFSEVFGISLD
jgi:hypothetical protein